MNGNCSKQQRLEPIGYVASCYGEKFGTPRQAGLAPSARGYVDLVAPYNRRELVRGLADFSHIWLLYQFHQALAEGWRSTVRPPRLGGRNRMGVLATRSPHRPNHLGLSAVALIDIETGENGVRLTVGGLDLVDGTPVLDIKPYLPAVDAIAAAGGGWAGAESGRLEVAFSGAAATFCRTYESRTGRPLARLIEETLRHDPRPASQHSRNKGYGMMLWDVNVVWSVEDSCCRVSHCEYTGPLSP